jgi:hypothetical protein
METQHGLEGEPVAARAAAVIGSASTTVASWQLRKVV